MRAPFVGQEAQHRVRGERADADVGAERLASGEARARESSVLHDERIRRFAGQDNSAQLLEAPLSGGAHQRGEAVFGVADVRAVAASQQRLLEQHNPRARGNVRRRIVEGGDDDHVPERGDGPIRLPARAEPVAQRALAQGGAVAVALPPHRQQRERRPRLLAQANVGVAQQRRQQVQRRGQRQRGERSALAVRRANLRAQALLPDR